MGERDPNAKEGMRIRLISMVDDPNPVSPGTEGTIRLIDGMGIIHVNWDNGRMIGLIPGIDKYELGQDFDTEAVFNNLGESASGGSAIKSTIKKSPSIINKSVPKSTKISSDVKSSMKSSGIKTDQVKKNFKSTKIKDIKVEANEIKGGKADNLTIDDLAKKHKVSVEKIKKEIEIGKKIEREHVGKDTSKATEIAMDHVFEFPDYYSNKRYGLVSNEKKLEKSEKKKGIKTEMTGVGAVSGTAAGASVGAVVTPAFGAEGPLTKNKGVRKPGPLKNEQKNIFTKSQLISEITTQDIDFDDDANNPWADQNGDGWNFNDKPFWPGGEIIDPLAKIPEAWDDSTLDISKEWDEYQEKHMKKEDVLRLVKTRINEDKVHTKKWDRCVKAVEKQNKEKGTSYTPEAVCTKSVGYEKSVKKSHRKKEIEEEVSATGAYVGPAFAAKDGEWRTAKNPIWKGGKIVQSIQNSGVLNPITEANTVKYNPQGKIVKVKKKCTKFPYCNQGAIDNPLNLSNTVSGSGTYVEETMKHIYEVAKETGKSFDEVYEIVKNNLNEGKIKNFFKK